MEEVSESGQGADLLYTTIDYGRQAVVRAAAIRDEIAAAAAEGARRAAGGHEAFGIPPRERSRSPRRMEGANEDAGKGLGKGNGEGVDIVEQRFERLLERLPSRVNRFTMEVMYMITKKTVTTVFYIHGGETNWTAAEENCWVTRRGVALAYGFENAV